MSGFVPESSHLREILIFCFHLKKSAAEAHRMLVEAYGEHALTETQCREWFREFRGGDFVVRNEERGRPTKKFKDADSQDLSNDGNVQSQKMRRVSKAGLPVPHQLAEREPEPRETTSAGDAQEDVDNIGSHEEQEGQTTQSMPSRSTTKRKTLNYLLETLVTLERQKIAIMTQMVDPFAMSVLGDLQKLPFVRELQAKREILEVIKRHAIDVENLQKMQKKN